MKNLSEIKKRYLKEPFNRRLGHLASDLARIYSFLDNNENKKAVGDIIEESKFFIEWTANEAPFEIQALFSKMQSKLALWGYRLSIQKESIKEIEDIKKAAKNWSARLIKSF